MGLLSSLFKYKCPRCRQGDMFLKPLDIKKPWAMYDNCQVCNLNFEPEPGFYYGALMVSYAISAWILLSIALILIFKFGWSLNRTMVVVILVGALSYIKILRLSRAIWLYFFVKYDPSFIPKGPSEVE